MGIPLDLVLLILIPAVLGVSFWLAKRAAGATASPEISFENVVLAIRVPKENEKEALAAEQMFASLHGLLRLTPGIQEHISFEIAGSSSGINFYAVCPRVLRNFVESQIYAQYPAAEIKEAEDYAGKISSFFDRAVEGVALKLAKPQYFPIRTFREFEVDPLAAITSAVSQLKNSEEIWIQILLRPIPDIWQEEGHNYVTAVRTGVSPIPLTLGTLLQAFLKELSHLPEHFAEALTHPAQKHALEYKPPLRKEKIELSKGEEDTLKSLELKLSKMGFSCLVRLVAVAPTIEEATAHLRAVTASFRQFSTANLNSFLPGRSLLNRVEFLESYRRRSLAEEDLYVLNTEELASIFHLPSISVETPLIDWSPAKRGEPPLNLPVRECTFIGRTTFREALVPFGIKRDDRTTHFYAVGKTGTGKTTLFKNMIVQDIRRGEGVGVIDPHGDLIEELLDFIPEKRLEDVVLFDPADVAHPVSLNVLECPHVAQKNLLASGLVSAFRKHFENSWGPRLEYLLNNAVLTLLEVPQTTMLGITRILSDKNYQKYIVHKINDPILKDFWDKEFKQMMGNPAFHTEAIAPIQNKIGRFLASTTIRNILGQARSTIKLDEVMNNGKIIFLNLSKGKIGEDNANLLGSLLISRLNFMAMQRVNVPPKERRDFYLYVDEFQNFASGSFASILSEARKYRLCLHLTHQYTAQLPDEVREAVFGNVGTMIAFALGAPDAAALAPEFAPSFTENDLISLERHHIYIKLMIDGVTEAPFSAVTDPPPTEKVGRRLEVVERSQRKYGGEVGVVEERVRRWTEKQFDLGAALAEETREKEGSNISNVSNISHVSDGGNENNLRKAPEGLVAGHDGEPKKAAGEEETEKSPPAYEPRHALPEFLREEEGGPRFNPLREEKPDPTVSRGPSSYTHKKNEVIIGS